MKGVYGWKTTTRRGSPCCGAPCAGALTSPATARLGSLFGLDGLLGLASTRASPVDETCSAFLNQLVSPPATLRGQVR
jgi:hypothetical protein